MSKYKGLESALESALDKVAERDRLAGEVEDSFQKYKQAKRALEDFVLRIDKTKSKNN